MKTLARMLLVLLCSPTLSIAADDVPGSKDHPLVTRMPGYHIARYATSEFDGFEPTVIGGADVRWEGKKYSISYAAPEEGAPFSMLQIVRNYEDAIGRVGGKKLGGDERRLAAEVRKGSAVTGIYVEAFNDGAIYDLTIVEMGRMRQDVVADAEAMGRDLAASGRTVVHGIFFDTGSATLRPESGPALAQMLELLRKNPQLSVFVVGHTDTTGPLEVNMTLSKDRAASVARALTSKGIAPDRVGVFGAGPHAPVASNRDEAGRSQNRRVELVERTR